MRRFAGITFLALLLSGTIVSKGRTAAIYSVNFIGERLEAGDVRSIALGGANQLMFDSLCVLHPNPAMMSMLPRVTIGAQQLMAVDSGSNGDVTERDTSFHFPAFRLAFPLTSWSTLSVGFKGRYNPDGGFSLRGKTDSGDEYTQTFIKSGGLFAIPLSLTFDLTRYAAIGLSYSREGGNVEERWDTVFDDSGFVPGAGFEQEELTGNGYGGGIILKPGAGLLIGASFESAVDYDTDIQRRYTQSSIDTAFTSTAKLPGRFAASLTWAVGNRFVLAASYAHSDLSQTEGFSFPLERLSNEDVLAFGFEWTRGLKIRRLRLPIRLSYSHETIPYDHPEGHEVTKYLIGVGTGIGLRGGDGKIDLALQFGQIGSADSNIVEDSLVRFYFAISGGEKWQRKGLEE